MTNEKLPIKFFAKREIDDLRVEPGGPNGIPSWVLTGDSLIERASALKNAFSKFELLIKEKESRDSAVPFTFIAKMSETATAKSRRGDIASLLKVGEKLNLLSLTASDELMVRLDSMAEMNEISVRLDDYEHNSFAISCLDTFREFKPEIESSSEDASYKIKLIDFQDYETNTAMERLFEHALDVNNIDFKKSFYTDQFPVYKVNVPLRVIKDALFEDDVYKTLFSISPMPIYAASLDSLEYDSTVTVRAT